MGNRRHRHELIASALLESVSLLKMAQVSAGQGKRRRGSGAYTQVCAFRAAHFEATINAVTRRMRQFSAN